MPMPLRPPRFSPGLRAKLFLATLSLAAIPLVGIGYVREMEALLTEQQEQNLLAAARAIATALNDRPALLKLKPEDPVLKREREEALRAIAGDGTATGGAAVIAIENTAEPPPVSEQVESIVSALNRAKSRIWVIDKRYRLLALAGSLRAPDTAAAPQPKAGTAPKPLVDKGSSPVSWWESTETTLLRPLYERLLTRPTEQFDDSLPEDTIVSGSEVLRAFAGSGATRWRATPDNRARILSAAHPVWAGDEVVAVVVVEESGNAIASFTNRAFEKLITATLAAFAAVAAIMLLFASRLAQRIRALRDEAESAVDGEGRMQGAVRTLTASGASGDEIGDLSRSFSRLLGRLGQHHDYLESLGSRITHEFRTPVAVVQSSLDNLAMQPLPAEARAYMQRAQDGIHRLNLLVTRLGEARRVESAIAQSTRECYDLQTVVTGCVEGYRAAYGSHAFQCATPQGPVMVQGAPELLAQALDKLIANAVSFATRGTPIRVSLTADDEWAHLAVANQGPPLPPGPTDQLFDSMTSIRDEAAPGSALPVDEEAAPITTQPAEPHLGLGLYIVRLVATFHGGTCEARNQAGPEGQPGVAVLMHLPVQSGSTSLS